MDQPTGASPHTAVIASIHLYLTEAEFRTLHNFLVLHNFNFDSTLRSVQAKVRAINWRLERRHTLPVGECKYCDDLRKEGTTFHPSHDASPNCESGQRHHCSCDTCF